MDDIDDLGVAVIALVFLAPLLLLVGLVWLIAEYHDEISNAIKVLASWIWKAHLAVGALVLRVVRDWPVRVFWLDGVSDPSARVAIILWLAVIPGLSTLVLLVFEFLFWVSVFGGSNAAITATFGVTEYLSTVLSVFSVVAIFCGYYRHYFKGPVTHHRLVRFVKEYYLMRADAQLAWLQLVTRLKLWWLTGQAVTLTGRQNPMENRYEQE